MRNADRAAGQSSKSPAAKKLTFAGIVAVVLVAAFCVATAFYYFTTPSDVILVTTAEIPSGLSSHITPRSLTDFVESHLQRLIKDSDGSAAQDTAPRVGLGPGPAKERVIPRVRGLSNSTSPLSKLEWKGLSLNLARSIGMSLRAKGHLELAAEVKPDKGYSLSAFLKEGADNRLSGAAPRTGGVCADLNACTFELAEQILATLDGRRLLKRYIEKDTEEANRKLLELYPKFPADSLKPDDLVAWGNAFYGVKDYDNALSKYKAALAVDGSFCPARVAVGFVHHAKAQREQDKGKKLQELGSAKKHFADGNSCDPANKYTRTTLCHTYMQEWIHSPLPRNPRLLDDAETHCREALKIDPNFLRADVNIGYVLYRQGRREESFRHFARLSEKHPKNAALFLNYGFVLYLHYVERGGVETLRRAAEQTLAAWNLDQSNDITAGNLGYYYYELGDYAKAEEFWWKADALNPGNPDILAGLALGAAVRGERDAALAALHRAVTTDREYCDPAKLQAQNDWSKRAAGDLAKLLRQLPKDVCARK